MRFIVMKVSSHTISKITVCETGRTANAFIREYLALEKQQNPKAVTQLYDKCGIVQSPDQQDLAYYAYPLRYNTGYIVFSHKPGTLELQRVSAIHKTRQVAEKECEKLKKQYPDQNHIIYEY